MNFFYDLNKKLNSIGAVPESTQLNERDLGKQLNELSPELLKQGMMDTVMEYDRSLSIPAAKSLIAALHKMPESGYTSDDEACVRRFIGFLQQGDTHKARRFQKSNKCTETAANFIDEILSDTNTNPNADFEIGRHPLPHPQGMSEAKSPSPYMSDKQAEKVMDLCRKGYTPDQIADRYPNLNKDEIDDIWGSMDDDEIMEAKGKKPDFLDLDKDGNKKESMKKAAADKKKNPFKKNMSEATDDNNQLKQEIKELEKQARYLSGEPAQTDPKTGHGYRPNYIKTVRKIKQLQDQLQDQQGMSASTGDNNQLKQEIKELEKLARHLSGEPAQTDPKTGHGYRPNYIKTVRKIEKLKAQLKSQKNMSEDGERKTTHGTEVTKGNITTHTRNYEPDVEDDNDFNAEPRKAGRPKGTKHATGATGPTGKSKLQNLKAIREEGDTCPHCGSKMVNASHDEKPAKKVGVTQSVPKKVKEADVAPAAEKAPSNKYGFGKGIYDSLNRQVDNLITEGMSVTVNMRTDDTGQPHKDITVHADGDDAAKLAELLNLAGIQQSNQSCSSCGQSPCGCGDQMVDENSPSNAPDTVFASVDQVVGPQYGGGPNAPHVMINPADSTFNPPGDMAQDTINAGPGARRLPATTNENKQADLGMSLYKELQQFKGK